MRVIFLEDVANIARVGEVKEVTDGYGRNFLIPRKLAVLAGPSASNVLEAQVKKKAHHEAQTEAEMIELANQLEGKEIVLKARTGAKDRLYGSITSADIADELSTSAGIVVDKRKIELAEPIRQLGSYEIAIRLTKDIIPKVKLTVVEEKEKGKEKVEKEVEEKVEKGVEEEADKTEEAESGE